MPAAITIKNNCGEFTEIELYYVLYKKTAKEKCKIESESIMYKQDDFRRRWNARCIYSGVLDAFLEQELNFPVYMEYLPEAVMHAATFLNREEGHFE